MIYTAKYNRLKISRATENGLYLTDEEGHEVLLPNRYVPKTYEIGDEMEVFVYHDSEDRPVATTQKPLIKDGEIANLKVIGFNVHGVFVDWGLPKDLFVPKSNQQEPMKVGESYPVYLYIDNVTGRAVGTTKLNRVIRNTEIAVRPKEEVTILVAQRRERGFRVIVNGQHWGMLYDNQIFTEINIGDILTGYVAKITEDNRIDITLQQRGFDQVKVAADEILEMIREAGGVLPLGDQSDPETVRTMIGMSKKVFKRSVGYLMSRGVVQVGEHTVELLKMKKK